MKRELVNRDPGILTGTVLGPWSDDMLSAQ
jgi:hypothetical protein